MSFKMWLQSEIQWQNMPIMDWNCRKKIICSDNSFSKWYHLLLPYSVPIPAKMPDRKLNCIIQYPLVAFNKSDGKMIYFPANLYILLSAVILISLAATYPELEI